MILREIEPFLDLDNIELLTIETRSAISGASDRFALRYGDRFNIAAGQQF
jgi:hypothetical protein